MPATRCGGADARRPRGGQVVAAPVTAAGPPRN